ncbi:MAG TPA: hypothetical protein VM534_01500, partial [Thermoanaerobaculia bacterium]|nr:hypothetical protein [Thermoanaerobaculia bacterium]
PPPPSPRNPLFRLVKVTALGLALGMLVIAGYWWVEIRPRTQQWARAERGVEIGRSSSVDVREIGEEHFDRRIDLPGSPIGMAWDGERLVLANRLDPWGFLTLEMQDDEAAIRNVQIFEEQYGQKVQFDSVAWNGSNWIGYTTASWFRQKATGHVFTIHDPSTLRVQEIRNAPGLLGCLVWDGEGYWAATRKNTRDAAEEAFLYRFDRDLRELSRHPSPIPGCQGMAWDGRFLWMVDVFDDSIQVIDPSEGTPATVHRAYTGIEYLSGIVWTGSELWISEYGDNSMRRLRPARIAEWTGERSPAALAAMAPAPASRSKDAPDVSELRRKLRSESWSERMSAEMDLKRLGVPVDYDREQNSSARREPEEPEVFDLVAEMRGDSLYGSWHIWFGDLLFNTAGASDSLISIPTFVRYEVSVEGGSLNEPIELVFDATPGDNIRSDVLLSSGLGPGRYSVGVFLHVQYVRPDGGNQILNHSTSPVSVER